MAIEKKTSPSSRQGAPDFRSSSRRVRHASHVIQTSRRAAQLVAAVTGLDDFERAMTALEVVVAGIAQRISPTEAGDLLAQLPSELRTRIIESTVGGPNLNVTRETLEGELSKHFEVDARDAAKLLNDVGTALEHLVSRGEIAHVRAQLPKDLQTIFRGEVAHRTP